MPLRLSAPYVPPVIRGRMLAPRGSAPAAGGGGGGSGADIIKALGKSMPGAGPSYLQGGDIGIPDDYAGLDVVDQPVADIGIPDDYSGVDLSDAIAQTKLSNALLG